jgi:hypothetical protein
VQAGRATAKNEVREEGFDLRRRSAKQPVIQVEGFEVQRRTVGHTTRKHTRKT